MNKASQDSLSSPVQAACVPHTMAHLPLYRLPIITIGLEHRHGDSSLCCLWMLPALLRQRPWELQSPKYVTIWPLRARALSALELHVFSFPDDDSLTCICITYTRRTGSHRAHRVRSPGIVSDIKVMVSRRCLLHESNNNCGII